LDDAIESAASLNIQTVGSCAGSLQLRLRRETDSLMQNIAILHLVLENERDREEAVSPPPSLEQLRSSSSQLRVMRCAAESRVHFPQKWLRARGHISRPAAPRPPPRFFQQCFRLILTASRASAVYRAERAGGNCSCARRAAAAHE
jgi:hypothetical protein